MTAAPSEVPVTLPRSDPALERKVMELGVNGQHLLFVYADDPAHFDELIAEVDAIVKSMTFER